MKFEFQHVQQWQDVKNEQWSNWTWQLRNSLRNQTDIENHFELSEQEKTFFAQAQDNLRYQITPYYTSLAKRSLQGCQDPIRRLVLPTFFENQEGQQQMFDPLAERDNSPVPRVIHRYSDRALFLVTDYCSVYCRYCTRKHFTGKDHSFASKSEYDEALTYFKNTKKIREVILSGGDPLTISDTRLETLLNDLRSIEHIEIIRIGSRIPVVMPMRVTESLIKIIKSAQPVFLMTHFNHPREITVEAKNAISMFVDNGIPVFNQMVLLNGINNHPAIVQALSRRLLYLRVKPYYMFQCDPSQGSDHLRTSVAESMQLQRDLWGKLSGLAMPNLCLDIPGGGGKVGLVPDYEVSGNGAQNSTTKTFRGFDGVLGEYIDPAPELQAFPSDLDQYMDEWNELNSSAS
jgi:lysine 2,3-aminomutase